MNLINTLVDMEAKGVNVDFIRKALRDSLLDSKAVFKRYNRKTNRYNTLTKTNRANNQYPSQNNQAQTNGTGVPEQAQGEVSGGKNIGTTPTPANLRTTPFMTARRLRICLMKN